MLETFFAKTKTRIGNVLYFFLEDHFRSVLIQIITILNSKTEKSIPKPTLISLKEEYYPSKTEGNIIDIRDKKKTKTSEKFKKEIQDHFELPDPTPDPPKSIA